jgi:hypothetical protein
MKNLKKLLALGPIAYEEGNFNKILNPATTITGNQADPIQFTLKIVNYVLFFLGLLAVGAIVYGGILFITSGGDSEKTTKARNTLLYAVIGIIIIVLAFGIVKWASGFLPAA